MNKKSAPSGLWISVILTLLALIARAQVTITDSDMFNRPGQFYQAYANNSSNTVPVGALLGTIGGPQVWDFSTGPQEVTYRFDYLTATNGTDGATFAALGATIAEKKTDLAGIVPTSWLYFRQDPANGRLDYGFYDPNFSPSQPENVFTNSLQDFPAAIHYGDTWQGSAVFSSIFSDSELGDFPELVTYSSQDKVDAYGVVILPGLGFLDCLRVHEVVEYDFAIDLNDGNGFQSIGSQALLNYYWLSPGHGIAVQINSTGTADGSLPPDSLPGGAAAVIRMYQTNHEQGTGTNSAPTIKNLTCTLGASGALLKWTPSPALKSYTVEYATNVTAAPDWITLQTVTNNFVIDSAGGRPTAPARLYRVLGN
jgi:hypothetical protein